MAAKPIVTKMPTQRSIVARFMKWSQSWLPVAEPTEHENGEHEVEGEDGERAAHDRASGGGRYSFGRGIGIVAFEHGDEAHRHAEHDALDDAVADVGPKGDARLH